MKQAPRLTQRMIDKLATALADVSRTDVVNQPMYVSPRAHEVRRELSRAHGILGTLEYLLEAQLIEAKE